jgi:hypothetical protein
VGQAIQKAELSLRYLWTSQHAELAVSPHDVSLRSGGRSPDTSEKLWVPQPPPSSAHRVSPTCTSNGNYESHKQNTKIDGKYEHTVFEAEREQPERFLVPPRLSIIGTYEQRCFEKYQKCKPNALSRRARVSSRDGEGAPHGGGFPSGIIR